MNKARLRLITRFYKDNIAIPSVLTMLIGIIFLFKTKDVETSPIYGLLLTKLFITGATIFLIHILKNRQYIYYNNLGVSTMSLWTYTIIPDVFVYILTMSLIRVILNVL